MKFTSVASLLMAFAAITSAAAVDTAAEDAAPLEARQGDVDLVVFWDQPNFQGNRVQARGKIGDCRNVRPDLNNKISSLRPSPHRVCRFWADHNCQGDLLPNVRDGIAHLGRFDNRISSYRCN